MDFTNIRELDVNEVIPPLPSNYLDPTNQLGGSRILVIGPSGSGKTRVINSLLYEKAPLIPVYSITSGSESVNFNYLNLGMPDLFIHHEYDENILRDIWKRQGVACVNLENPWIAVVLDDVFDEPSVFKKDVQNTYFKRGRHMKMLYVVASQYCIDIPKALRRQTTGVFIMANPNLADRRILFEQYGSMIAKQDDFNKLMDLCTQQYGALYIRTIPVSQRIEDNVFWYRAKPVPPNFKFGCDDYRWYHDDRYSPDQARAAVQASNSI